MERNSVIVLAGCEEQLASSVAAVEAGGSLEVVACSAEPGELAALVATQPQALVLVRLGEKGDLLLDAVEALPLPRPAFVAMGPEEEGRLILRAMRLGAREYLPLHLADAELRSALERALARPPVVASAGSPAPIVAVLGAKGGTGATLVACQLALGLRRAGGRVALVDCDLRHGDVSLYLDLQPRYGLADVARDDAIVDATYLENVLHAHASGVRVLAAPRQPEEAELVGAAQLGFVLGLVRETHDWVVVDLPRDFGDVSLTVLDLADTILLVTTPDVPSLHHSRRMLALLERLGHAPSRLRLVVNRAGRASHVGARDARDFLGRAADASLPNDFRAAQESVDYGRPVADVAPRSPLIPALVELGDRVHDWCGVPRPERPDSETGVERVRSYLKKKLHGPD